MLFLMVWAVVYIAVWGVASEIPIIRNIRYFVAPAIVVVGFILILNSKLWGIWILLSGLIMTVAVVVFEYRASSQGNASSTKPPNQAEDVR